MSRSEVQGNHSRRTTDSFVLHVLTQSGNTISVYDERDSSTNPSNATLSGYVLSYSGGRYPVGGCTTMTAVYSVTINTADQDNGCTVPVSVHATKL